jgi:AraC-like DNA-binding protein
MLRAQLDLLAHHGLHMGPDEAAAAMQAVSGLATAYLRQLRGRDGEAAPDDGDAALFAAACALIERWKEDPALTVERVAGVLGCSRATLFRLFERRGVGIGAHIRESRLAHGKHLLRDPALDIGQIALRSGYADASAFGKAFRQRFGLTPRDWRMGLQ